MLLGARLAVAAGDFEMSARFLGAGMRIRDSFSCRLEPFVNADFEAAAGATRQMLGGTAYDTMWTQGQGLSPQEAHTAVLRYADAYGNG